MNLNRIKLNQMILQLNGFLNIYPWQFERKGEYAVSRTAFLPLLGFRIQLVLSSFYAVYIDLTLLRKVFRGLDNARYDMFGMHLLRSLLATTFSYWGYEFFVKHSKEHEMLYNFTQLSPDLPRRLGYPIKGSVFQELVFALTPFMLYSFAPMLVGLFLLDGSDEQFFFSLLPAEMRESWSWKLLAAAVELWFVHFLMAMAHFRAFHCVAFVRIIQTSLAHCAEQLRKRSSEESKTTTNIDARDGYGVARTVQLCMVIYNVSTSGVIFAHKLLNLSGGIVGLYFLIRLMFVQPAVSLLFFILGFDSITFYTVMWDNASLIQFMISSLKGECDLQASSSILGWPYFRRVSKSVPSIGVKVGGFRNMERDSTLIFLDFVFSNVVTLLIGLKK